MALDRIGALAPPLPTAEVDVFLLDEPPWNLVHLEPVVWCSADLRGVVRAGEETSAGREQQVPVDRDMLGHWE
ncbi:hypothetical protein U9M48_000438 [Paspalum notatum var. saurae]|uniref:Uncharacterized protein n=1 Tax=Paspalum notatum var. saurae TaxID=547442 RepID=A0AAQ3PLH3_PASNO